MTRGPCDTVFLVLVCVAVYTEPNGEPKLYMFHEISVVGAAMLNDSANDNAYIVVQPRGVLLFIDMN